MLCSAATTLTGWAAAFALGGSIGAVWAASRSRRAPTGMPTAEELRGLRAALEAAETEAADRHAEVASLRRRLAEHRPATAVAPERATARNSSRVRPPRPPGAAAQLARRAGGVANGP